MKKKSPISVDRLQVCIYDCDQIDEFASIKWFPYDDRHDFVKDKFMAGIAVKVEVSNRRCDKGLRRDVSFALIDMAERCEVGRRHTKLSLAKDGYKDVYIQFPSDEWNPVAGHAYKLAVYDVLTGEALAKSVIHLFDKTELGEPAEWYRVCDGGVRPSWMDCVFKSLDTVDGHEYLVQFNVSPDMNCCFPSVMPELEIRLHYPDGEHVQSVFREPFCKNAENHKVNLRTVEYGFETVPGINGVFYAELLCMEYPIAGFVFDTASDNDVSGSWCGHELEPMEEYSPDEAVSRIDEYLPYRNDSESSDESDSIDDAIARFLESDFGGQEEESCDAGDNEFESAGMISNDSFLSLEHLTGLRSVKEKLGVYECIVRFNKMRGDKGLPVTPVPLHSMFLGSPGTGKTTVAKMMGAMLHRAGVLSKGHVVVRERATLLGQNYNSESEKTLAAIEEAQGGILFIDEAYQLYQPNDSRDPGKFVIETLLTALADESNRDWMLVLAGYRDEMNRMFEMNPGFKSRIPDSNIYVFEDFTESELMEIAENYFARYNYTLSPEAQTALAMRLKADYEGREKNFGNARHIVNMIQTEILPSMAVRVINEGRGDEQSLTEVSMSDIPWPVQKPIRPRHRVGFIP